MNSLCYVCEKEVIKPSGYSKSDILIIGDAPGKDEIEQGKAFVGQTGKVLRQEAAELGFDLIQSRICNLWFHAPTDKKDKNYDACFKASIDVCLDEARGKWAVLLIGADPCEYFTGYKVSDVNGLQVKSNQLSAPIIYAMMQPTIVFKGKGVGEIRFALSNFVKHIKEEGLI